MGRIALLSFHGCPVARLGEKDTGGMNVYVLQLAREFAKQGNQVDVYTRFHDPEDPQVVQLCTGARVIHLKAGPYDTTKQDLYQYIPEFLNALYSFQRSEGLEYEIVHSHYWLSGRIGLALREKWDVPHVSTFHTLAKTKLRARAGERESDLRSAIEKRVIDEADMLIVSTEQEKEDIVRLYDGRRRVIEVVPAGVDLELFQPMDETYAKGVLGLPDKQIVLYVGRIEPLKGIDILLQSLAMLEEGSDTRLLIVGGSLEGDEELDRLKNMAEELGLGERVTFTGSVSQTDLPIYYAAADVFVLPSHYESFGLVALEAMACGTPVVASRVGGLKTFIKHGESGYLIPWRCPDPFAQRIETLLANETLRKSMGAAARTKALEMSWSGVAGVMLECYAGLMDDHWESATGA